MPTTQKPSAARGGRRGKHRKNRLKMLEAKPHWLASDAPYGEYLVDTIALELFRGAAVSHRDEGGFVRLVREDINLAAQFAALRARIRLRWRPEKLRLARQLFKDLFHIQQRIQRNKGLDRTTLLTVIDPISKVKGRDLVGALLSSLGLAEVAIQEFLDTYKPLGEGGNYDWLTRAFVDEIFEVWCRYVQVDLNDEVNVFNKLVAAAWRDVGFPTKDKDGQRLEDWLADRVRKDFPEKTPKARKERQELDLELARSRADMCPIQSE
jgi:hypothetical protein